MRVPILTVVAALLAACSSDPTPATSPSGAAASTPSAALTASPSSSPSPSAVPGPPAFDLDDRVIAELDIPGADFPVAAYDAVWIASQDRPDPAIERIDPATNEVVATIPVEGRRCQGLVGDFDAIWACSDDGLVRIDPATNEVVTVIPFGVTQAQARLAAGAGSVWALGGTDGVTTDSVVRFDPATNTAVATIPLGHVGSSMTFGFDALWVTSTRDNALIRVDPATNEASVALDDLDGASWLAVDDDSLWVTLHGDPDRPAPETGPNVVRIDAMTLEVVAEIDTGSPITAGGIVAGDGVVWARSADVFLTRIDPATNEVVETIDASSTGGGDVIVAYGSVWATSYDFGHVWRIEP